MTLVHHHTREYSSLPSNISLNIDCARRLLSEPPVMQKPRTCLDLSKGERPNSWAEVTRLLLLVQGLLQETQSFSGCWVLATLQPQVDGRVLRENLHIAPTLGTCLEYFR